jgi:hypothetical protein
MARKGRQIVTGYAKMWPREVFDFKEKKKLLVRDLQLFEEPGVYILYRDEHPYYVGQASKRLQGRIWAHANQPKDPYFNFWNYFSAFLVPKGHLDEVEAILIAAMPTANSANPKLKPIDLPKEVRNRLRDIRLRAAGQAPKGRSAGG